VEWEKRTVHQDRRVPVDEPGGIPEWAWPAQGDRAHVVGTHIFDCGHGAKGYRAEIHPPRLLVTYRNTAVSHFAMADERRGSYHNDRTGQPTWANRVDIFASSFGGKAVSNEHLNTPDKPDWWQPVNDQNYQFMVKAPPKPSPDAQLTYWLDDHPVSGATGPDLEFQPLPNYDGYLVTIPFKGWRDPLSHLMMVGETVWVGWTKAPADMRPHLRHYTVHVDAINIWHDLASHLSTSADWTIYGYVNALGQSVLRDDDQTALHEPLATVKDGMRITRFWQPDFHVTLVDSQPLHIEFLADNYNVFNATAPSFVFNDEAGTADRVFGANTTGWEDSDVWFVPAVAKEGEGTNGWGATGLPVSTRCYTDFVPHICYKVEVHIAAE
jgi:hypothetical protein